MELDEIMFRVKKERQKKNDNLLVVYMSRVGQDLDEECRTENDQGPRGTPCYFKVPQMSNPILPLLSLRNENRDSTMSFKLFFPETTRDEAVWPLCPHEK